MDLDILKADRYKDTTNDFLKFFHISLTKPDYQNLCRILDAFQNLPYENVSKLIRSQSVKQNTANRFRLPDLVWEDYKDQGLGGTCYSLTFFLWVILINSGFKAYLISCDMKWGENVHCNLAVVLNHNAWLCDPGYLLTTPLLLSHKRQMFYRTDHSGVELSWNGNNYLLATFHGNNFKWRYKFQNLNCNIDDFTHYWLASFEHPGMNAICLTKQLKKGMVYFHNNYYREVSRTGINKKRLSSGWSYEIEKSFGIHKNVIDLAFNITQEKKVK